MNKWQRQIRILVFVFLHFYLSRSMHQTTQPDFGNLDSNLEEDIADKMVMIFINKILFRNFRFIQGCYLFHSIKLIHFFIGFFYAVTRSFLTWKPNSLSHHWNSLADSKACQALIHVIARVLFLLVTFIFSFFIGFLSQKKSEE